MPEVRAVNHSRLVPLRSFRASQERKLCLLGHHKANHPNEAFIHPIIRQPDQFTSVLGYEFFGQFIEAARVNNTNIKNYIGTLASARPMRISDVAALALEQTFGAAERIEDAFSVEWGMPENRSEGAVFWDVEADRIIAKTKEGLILSIEGTNIVEAAVYLPRQHQVLKEMIARIPEGVQFMETRVEGPREAWSKAASPLQVKFNLPNLSNLDQSQIDRIVRDAFLAAVANRVS